MRLVSLARFRYGLNWPGKLPRVNWLLWIEALTFIALLLLVYALVDYISQNAKLSDRAVVAERKQMKAEAALAHCLNGKTLDAGNDGMIMCDKALWVKL